MAFSVESFYAESRAKAKLKVTGDGTIFDRDFD
jgi:hypothetical protein